MKKRDLLLVVDDMEINRVVLGQAFCDLYTILEAENGADALNLIHTHSDQLAAVLLDVVMPVMDGFQVVEQMYTQDLLSRIPVFLITADCSEANMRRGYELGVMDIIGKPIIPYFIRRRVCSVVELFQARERLSRTVAVQEQALEEKAQEIQQLNTSIIKTLSAAIEFRDCESGEHVQRIHDLTGILLRDLRHRRFGDCAALTDEEIDEISTAAIMHDVGKIAIPDQILNKPGRLTREEFEIMKTHTVKGCELLDRIPKSRENPVYQYAYDICRHHHERWDGRGYPDGLKGDEISIWSQVVSLADVYDALTSRRVYKPAFSPEEAVRMILDGECGAFNPALLESFRQQAPQFRFICRREP